MRLKKRAKPKSKAERIAYRLYGIEVGDTIRFPEKRSVLFPFGLFEDEKLTIAKIVLVRIGQDLIGIGIYFNETGTKSVESCFVGNLTGLPMILRQGERRCNLDVLFETGDIEVVKAEKK